MRTLSFVEAKRGRQRGSDGQRGRGTETKERELGDRERGRQTQRQRPSHKQSHRQSQGPGRRPGRTCLNDSGLRAPFFGQHLAQSAGTVPVSASDGASISQAPKL